ncbi:MAG: sulfatase-like hydrolase/transferase [Sphaerochaetaceae bacterium]
MSKPNILFLLTDDQRNNTINALGNCDIITPNMDELVRCGTSFSNAYIPGGYTGAVCMPSRAMIHSGRYLTSLEMDGQNIPQDHKLLGECFKETGYNAFGTGKWHNGPKAFTRSFTSGKNAFFGGMWDHWNVPLCNYDPLGNYDNIINFVADFMHGKKVSKIHCDRFFPGKHSSQLVAESTIEFINNTSADTPFFCYSAFLAPHDPRTMPDQFRALYDNKEIQIPENFQEEYPVVYQGDWMRDEMLIPYPRTVERVESELKDYYAMITHLDHEIGRIIDALKEKGVYENTIIILAGDNGLSLGSHGFLGKQNLFEEAIKIPLVISGPSIKKNKIVENNIILMDIYPTLCDLVGIEIPHSVEGTSFKNILQGKQGPSREEIYYIMLDRARGIRQGDWKLCYYTFPDAGKTSEVLVNLREDPDELCNLAMDEQYATKKALLRDRIIELRNEYKDTERVEAKRFWDSVIM